MVAETVKAISAHYGGFIHTHLAIAEVVAELARLAGNAGDTETRNWISADFLIASKLHSNFYENEMPDVMVLGGLISCEELSQKRYELFYPPATAHSRRPAPSNASSWKHLTGGIPK